MIFLLIKFFEILLIKKYYHYNPFSIDYNQLFLLFCRDWLWKANIIDYYLWNFSAGIYLKLQKFL